MEADHDTEPARCRFLSCPLDRLSPAQIHSRVSDAIRTGGRLRIEGLNVAKLVQARREPALMRALQEAEIVHLDGAGVALGGQLLGYHLPRRRAGCDLMLDLVSQAAREKYRVYFLGATREVVSKIVDELCRRFPDLEVAGARDGYFAPDEEGEIVEEIQRSGTHLLFLGISSPKKELFIARWWSVLGVAVSMGVGGSFDVICGQIKRAPLSMQRMGLEWLFRLWQEPRRLAYRYLSTNMAFGALLLREVLGWSPGASATNGSRSYPT
jgi:N-acetylglucosaminyldiphosphoundecaprenol N-acetyl-beta-D-mannosaminyltransferase